MGRYKLFGSSLEPPYTALCIGVTLLAFHSNGNTPARIEAENIPVREGAITIFNSLFGTSSKQVEYFSSGVVSRLWTLSTVGICSEKVLSVGLR